MVSDPYSFLTPEEHAAWRFAVCGKADDTAEMLAKCISRVCRELHIEHQAALVEAREADSLRTELREWRKENDGLRDRLLRKDADVVDAERDRDLALKNLDVVHKEWMHTTEQWRNQKASLELMGKEMARLKQSVKQADGLMDDLHQAAHDLRYARERIRRAESRYAAAVKGLEAYRDEAEQARTRIGFLEDHLRLSKAERDSFENWMKVNQHLIEERLRISKETSAENDRLREDLADANDRIDELQRLHKEP